jgi:hypothetical protein
MAKFLILQVKDRNGPREEERIRKAHQHVLEEQGRDPLHGREICRRHLRPSLEWKEETNHHEEDHKPNAETVEWIWIRWVFLFPSASRSSLRRLCRRGKRWLKRLV